MARAKAVNRGEYLELYAMTPSCGSGPLVSDWSGPRMLAAPGNSLNFLISRLLVGAGAGLTEVWVRHVRLAKTWPGRCQLVLCCSVGCVELLKATGVVTSACDVGILSQG